MKSIRKELVSLLLGGTGVILVFAGAIFYGAVKRNLFAVFDETTLVKADAVASMMELSRRGLSMETGNEFRPEFEPGSDPDYFQIWLDDGTPLYRSPSLGEDELLLPADLSLEPEFFEVTLPDGRPGRGAGLLVEPALDLENDEDYDEVIIADENGVADTFQRVPKSRDEIARNWWGEEQHLPRFQVVVARSVEGPLASLAAIRNGLLLAGGLGAAAVALLVLWVVPRRLSPVIRLGNRVQEIDATSLSSRLPETGLPAELAELPRKINELLARLEQSFDRERRMTANLAHDLRTPLAELRSAVEVSRRWPEDRTLNEQALETAESTSVQMTTMVAALLKLARIEAKQTVPEPEVVPLRDLVDRLWSTLARNASDHDICFENRVNDAVVVRTDRALLSLALINLLENAVRYSPTDAVIKCVSEVDSDGVVWSVTNPSSDLKKGDLAHLTEPFWQKDGARSEGRGSGLGLTLANTIASVLGVSLSLELEQDEFSARLRFRNV